MNPPAAAMREPETLPQSRAEHDRMANAIRALAMDAVEQAKSGHPGLPMGAADVATVLFTQFLKFDPADPQWPDRDRFVLSAGHGSMLLYALLYLLGYEAMTIDQIKRFRQLGSNTPGHPENFETPGIETTTGPLGQGLGNAVGMAIAERHLAAEFGDIVDHHTYVLASDGDLMEGISQEAIALAGHLKLNRLIVLFDDNGISIDGPLSLADSVDQVKRFEAAGLERVAYRRTRSAGDHDSNRGGEEIRSPHHDRVQDHDRLRRADQGRQGQLARLAARRRRDQGRAREARLDLLPPFEIPADILSWWRAAGQRSKAAHKAWDERLAALPMEKRSEFARRINGDLPLGLDDAVRKFKQELANAPKEIATRIASENALSLLTATVPEMVGGSADLTGSNNTRPKGMAAMSASDYAARFIHYGIREHGMAAAMNGMALHRGVIPYSGTFLVFSDYCRPAIRLAALMGERVIHVMTHDSIGLGEDGPTHQPVEHLAALRAIPNLHVFRPCDTVETIECWQLALESNDAPSVLALTRQNLPQLRKEYVTRNLCAGGAYEIAASIAGQTRVSIFASGSEVAIAVEAKKLLDAQGVLTRVVSVPCMELFAAQEPSERATIIGSAAVNVAVEAGVRQGWDAIIGSNGVFVGMHGFGASAPYKDLYRHFGITPEKVAEAALSRLGT